MGPGVQNLHQPITLHYDIMAVCSSLCRENTGRICTETLTHPGVIAT